MNYQHHQTQGGHPNSTSGSFGKKASIAAPGYDVSFQKSGKQIVQGQQALYGHHAQQQLNSTGGSAGANKTLPLSVFEMQFYQGDFVLQQNQAQ